MLTRRDLLRAGAGVAGGAMLTADAALGRAIDRALEVRAARHSRLSDIETWWC